MVENDAAVARVVRSLEAGHFTRVSGSGDTLGITDGRLYMWFACPQRCGEVIRREFRVHDLDTQVAIHFRILRKCARAEVEKAWKDYARKRMHPITQRRGFWYAVHGD